MSDDCNVDIGTGKEPLCILDNGYSSLYMQVKHPQGMLIHKVTDEFCETFMDSGTSLVAVLLVTFTNHKN